MGILSKLLGREKQQIVFEKESLAAGVAAGSARKSIEIVEENTRRTVNMLEDRLPERTVSREEFLQRISLLERGLGDLTASVSKLVEKEPPKIPSLQLQQQELLEPTETMQKIHEILKQKGKISYEDLSKETGLTLSSLRAIVSIAKRRGMPFITFREGRRGIVALESESQLALP